MERIGQAEVITTLERLHQELKAQTRDSKVDQHSLLRKSFHYVTATLHKPVPRSQLPDPGSSRGGAWKRSEVTHRVLQELFALLVGGDGFAPPRIRILSAALARELSVGETPYFFRDNFGGNFARYDQNKVTYFLSVLSELSNSQLLIQNTQNLVNWFTADTDQLVLKMVSLSNLIVLAQRFPNVLDKDKHIRPVEAKFRQLLTGASLETRKTTSTTFFGVRIVSTSSACAVTEIDGTPSHDFFTCINNSYDYSEDQILNVRIFSSLYQWIFHLYQAQLLYERRKQSREDIVSKLEHFGLVFGHLDPGDEAGFDDAFGPPECGESDSRGEKQLLSPIGYFTLDDSFRQVVIQVCLRILSQVERDIASEKVSYMQLGARYVISDLDWMKEFTEATSMEAVRILDLLCLMDPSLVSRIFPAVKKVYERTANRQSGLVFAAVLQFFVNHGQHVIFDVDPVLHHFFADYVSVRYRHQLLAMSTLLFLTTNTSKLLLHTPVFPKYYPAIIKLLAWHPRTVAGEILPLIPAMVGPTTFIELFHTLLDLPLTAAFMEQCDRPEASSGESSWSRVWLDRFAPAFKALQQYILRNEAGGGGSSVPLWETRDETQLSMVRVLWNHLPVTPRVSSVCKLVPRFLRVYFDVLLSNAPPECIERVVPLLLQRFRSLYPVDFFLSAVHLLFIETLQAIFQQWPEFLVSLKTEIVQAISYHFDMQGQLLVLHLCWIVGELLNPAMCKDGSKGDVVVFFEALEHLAYEAISAVPAQGERASASASAGAAGAAAVASRQATAAGVASRQAGMPRASSASAGGAGGTVETACGGQIPLTAAAASAATPDHAKTGGEGVAALGGAIAAADGARHLEETAQSGEEDGPSSAARSEVHEEDGHGPEGAGGLAVEAVGAEKVFSPRFVAVIIASLTKLGTKFPEFAPRVVWCFICMRQHYETDTSNGIEFVWDRLTDSLQLLRHASISNSIYSASQVLEGSEPNRLGPLHRSALSSLSHLSHNPSAFTVGALLHDFELPFEPPVALLAKRRASGTLEADGSDWEGEIGAGMGRETGRAALLQGLFTPRANTPPPPAWPEVERLLGPSGAGPSGAGAGACAGAVPGGRSGAPRAFASGIREQPLPAADASSATPKAQDVASPAATADPPPLNAIDLWKSEWVERRSEARAGGPSALELQLIDEAHGNPVGSCAALVGSAIQGGERLSEDPGPPTRLPGSTPADADLLQQGLPWLQPSPPSLNIGSVQDALEQLPQSLSRPTAVVAGTDPWSASVLALDTLAQRPPRPSPRPAPVGDRERAVASVSSVLEPADTLAVPPGPASSSKVLTPPSTPPSRTLVQTSLSPQAPPPTPEERQGLQHARGVVPLSSTVATSSTSQIAPSLRRGGNASASGGRVVAAVSSGSGSMNGKAGGVDESCCSADGAGYPGDIAASRSSSSTTSSPDRHANPLQFLPLKSHLPFHPTASAPDEHASARTGAGRSGASPEASQSAPSSSSEDGSPRGNFTSFELEVEALQAAPTLPAPVPGVAESISAVMAVPLVQSVLAVPAVPAAPRGQLHGPSDAAPSAEAVGVSSPRPDSVRGGA